jgi:HrpA-like RNA helicase
MPASTRVENETNQDIHEAPIDLNLLSRNLDTTIQTIRENNNVPILEEPVSQQIDNLLENNNNIFINAKPGTGKTIGVTLRTIKALLKRDPNRNPRLLVTEPRRNAVEKQSAFLGKIMDSDNPQRYVDYHHGDRPMGKKGPRNIEFTVEMSLLNELLRDPELKNYDAVMLDEVHGIKLRLLMPLLRKAQEKRKNTANPLKLIFATGTAEVIQEKVVNYFPETKSINVEKPPHPLHKHWDRETIPNKEIAKKAAQKAIELLKDPTQKGDVLAFLPGQREINEAMEEFQRLADQQHLDLDLFSMRGGAESQRNQEIINEIVSKSRTKNGAIFLTNVGEEALTIDTVNKVIVSGRRVTKKRDRKTGIYYYERDWITESSEGQQAGRSNRKGPGDVYYLYTHSQQLAKELDDENIEDDILMLKLATEGEDENSLEFLDPLDKQRKEKAENSLKKLGILDNNGKIINKQMVETMRSYEVDIHYARMIYESEQQNQRDALGILVGIFNSGINVFNDDFQWTEELRQNLDLSTTHSDAIILLRLWNKFANNEPLPSGINTKAFTEALKFRKNLLKKTKEEKPIFNLDTRTTEGQQTIKAIETCVFSGLQDQLLTRDIKQYHFDNGTEGKINIDPSSILYTLSPKPKRIVSAQLQLRRQDGQQQIFASFNQEVPEEALPQTIESLLPPPEQTLPEEQVNANLLRMRQTHAADIQANQERLRNEENVRQEIRELAGVGSRSSSRRTNRPAETTLEPERTYTLPPAPPPKRNSWQRFWDRLRGK